ncbi:MAG: prolyl oligopeptidase family serine peptidase, partial [Acidimicrobiales bacterium]
MPPPAARVDDVVDVLHGVAVADPYRWLEDGSSAETRAWAAAQNARTRDALDELAHRDAGRDRLAALLRAGTAAAPAIEGGLVFSLDRWGEHDQSVLCTRPLAGSGPAEPTVVLDLLRDSDADDDTAAIDWYRPSRDGTLVASGTSKGGDERPKLQVFRPAGGG